jgi:Carboxypeptidase regulatory-like domain/TonB-dependent Receptor Plug Domain
MALVHHAIALFITSLSVGAPAPANPPAQEAATIRGTVLDRANGTPLEDVSVQLQDAKLTVKTDASGRFELTGVPPGRRTVYVSIVGFILVKRTVDVAPGQTLDLTIPLSEGTGTYTEEVTVTAERFPEREKAVPSQQSLGSADIQNLRNVLTNDPLRAIQILPGVTSGDDFRSEFAVRGSGPSHVNFTFDGIPTPFLVHTVQDVQDGGSIAMVNGDILDSITLLNGSYPQRFGNRLGAELDFQMREGSRERRQIRVGVSGTDASVVVEGPLGARKAGSWLFSARKSYLDMLLDQISDDNDFGFGFSDLQGKFVYDFTARHRLELSLLAGRSRLDQDVEPGDLNDVQDGRNAAQLANAAWRFTASPSFVMTHRVAVARNQYSDENLNGFELSRGGGLDLTWRTDIAKTMRPSLTIEAGAQVQRQQRERSRSIFFDPTPVSIESYDDSAVVSSAYAQVRWTASRMTVTPGARVDHWSLTSETGVSPWVQADVRITDSTKLRAGGGIYRQAPSIEQVSGVNGGPLTHERAYHLDVGFEHLIRPDLRWQVTLYNREERDVLRLPGSDVRLDRDCLCSSPTSPWINALDGYARGIELLVQRRNAAGLSGWASYSLGFNRYRDRTTGEAFDGDFDQRHTLNLYALYRLSHRFSLAAKLRAGSNVPAPGYWVQQGDNYFVGPERNTLRVPAYLRLDVRGTRTFNWRDKRLTLFVEALNVLGHDNVRFNTPFVSFRTGQAFGMFESMIPFVPSAGILLEF